jgi:hypothetical protein
MSAPLHCYGALALEIAAAPRHALLAREATDELGALLGVDLQRLLPGIEALDLAFAAAHFDPCELLRPGWPVHAALSDLAQRAPGRGRGRVIGFGAHLGTMPATPLQPEPGLFGGPLRLLPFALLGEAAVVADVGRAMESRLLETGMAGAATALYAQEHFGGRLEHARYLSLHDLCAMTAMQYEHAGLGALWPLIEAALLAPESEEWLDAPREPLARWNGREVVIAEREGRGGQSVQREHGVPDAGFDSPDGGAVRLRRRQFESVLGAHGIEVRRHVVAGGIDPRVALREPDAGAR